MDDPIILAIETSCEHCMVSVAQGSHILFTLSNSEAKSHSQKLLSLIEEVLTSANYTLRKVSVIAVSHGPGSYTGLRIGVSVAKGLAMALDIPLITVNTLVAMATWVSETHPGYDLYIPMLDARRLEIYTLIASAHEIIEEPMAVVVEPSTFEKVSAKKSALCFGSGADKYKKITNNHIVLLEGITPSSEFLIRPVLEKYYSQQFADTIYLEPFYLKEFYSTSPAHF